MKKKILYSSAICLAILAFAVVFANNSTGLTAKATELCNWYHYESSEPTYETHGNVEYWICCLHHEYSLSLPTSGKGLEREAIPVTEIQYNELEERKEEENSPYIPSYKSAVDEVVSLINALPTENNLKPYNLDSIKNARTKYDALATSAKAYVTNYSKLQNLETSYESCFGLVLDLSANQLSSTGCPSDWTPTYTQSAFVDNTYGKGTSLTVTTAKDAYEFAYSNASSVSSYKYVALYVYAPVELHFFISRQNWRNNILNVNSVPDLTGSVISDTAIANKEEANSVQTFGLSIGWHEIIFDASRFSTSGFVEIWGSSSKTAQTAFSGWKISNFYGIKEYYDVKKVNSMIANLPTEISGVTSLTASTIEGIDTLYNSLSSSSKSLVVGYDSFEAIRTYVNNNYVSLSSAYDDGVKTNIFIQEMEYRPFVDTTYGAMSKLSLYHTQSPYEHCGIKPNKIIFDDISSFDYVTVNIYNPLSTDVTASFVNGDYGYLDMYTLPALSWTELKATPLQLSQGISSAYVLIYSSSPITNDGWLISSFYGTGVNPGQAVAELIDNLPSANDLVIGDYDRIMNVKRSYDNLTEAYKAFVTNYQTLLSLIAVYQDDFGYISNSTSYVTKGSFDYAHTADYQASIVENQSDTYYGRYTQINFESFEEFKQYSSGDTWGYTPCVKINPNNINKSYNNLMFYMYNPTSSVQNIYLYKGYWIPADATYKNEADQEESSSTNQISLKSGWTRIIINSIGNVDFNNFVIGFCGKGQGTCESGWKITALRGQIDHEFSGNY